MEILILGIALFFGIHSLKPVFPQQRLLIIERIGSIPYKLIYALIAAVGLGLMVYGYIYGPYDLLWAPLPAALLVTFGLMIPAALFLVGADFPTNWGKAVKHPMMIGTLLWAVAHLWSNGHTKGVLLFGSFGIYAIFMLYKADWNITVKPRPLFLNILWLVVSVLAYFGIRYLHTL